MNTSSVSPPPPRSATSSPSIANSTGTASSYSSPLSHDEQDTGDEPTHRIGMQFQSNATGNQDAASGSDLKSLRFDDMSMFGEGCTVPTMGDLMMMDLDMNGGGPSSPVGEIAVRKDDTQPEVGISDVAAAVNKQILPRREVSSVSTGSNRFAPRPTVPVAPGPLHRNTSAPNPSTSYRTQNTNSPGSSSLNHTSNASHGGLGLPGMSQRPVSSFAPSGPQQRQGHVPYPNSPVAINAVKSATGVGAGNSRPMPMSGSVAPGLGHGRGNGVGNSGTLPGQAGQKFNGQTLPMTSQSSDARSSSSSHRSTGYPVIYNTGQVQASSSPLSSTAGMVGTGFVSGMRGNRPGDGPGIGPSVVSHSHALPAVGPTSSARSVASSTGTGPSVSVRRKNVSARNMGGDGSSQEDLDSGGNGSGGSGDDRGGSGGVWTAKGRRTDRLFAGVGAGDRASWPVASPKKEELNDLPLMIRGIKRRGAKSRVETQIKFRLCLVQPVPNAGSQQPSTSGLDGPQYPSHPPPTINIVNPSYQHASAWQRISTFKALRLKPGLGMRRKPVRKSAGGAPEEAVKMEDDELNASDGDMLYLSSEVVCASSGREVLACEKCLDRETRRAESRGQFRGKAPQSESDGISPDRTSDSQHADSSHSHLVDQAENHIISWNCGPVVKIVNGECELAARMVCYSRHHKEKAGFRMTIRLRDAEGRLIASATAPTILITDDHKTSISKATVVSAALPQGLTLDSLGNPLPRHATAASATSRSDKAGKRRVRDDSASLDGDAKSSSRAAKAKPYHRNANSDTRSIGSVSGVLSPRTGLSSHGLSMTPLHGRSVPGSPSGMHGNYFSMLPIPGSGTISPGVLIPGADSHISPLGGFAADLPAISQRLSRWAEGNEAYLHGTQVSLRESNNGMHVDDDQWAYASSDSQAGVSLDGGDSYLPAQMAMEGLQLTYANGQQHFAMPGEPGGFGSNGFAALPDQMMRQDIEPDFDSMLNLSPSANPVDLPDFETGVTSASAGLAPTWPSSGPSYPTPPLRAHPSSYGMQQAPTTLYPKITRVIPPEGDVQGGTEVTILGENFTSGTMILFGKSPAVTLQLYGPTTLVCLLPPSPIGPASVPVFARNSLQPMQIQDGSGMTVFFTYHDVSDRKLMEMALTAVGLRVTGKVVGAVEIARRIMSAPQAEPSAEVQVKAEGNDVDSDAVVQEALAQELAQSVYSDSPEDFEQAVIRFLAVFLPETTRTRRAEKYRPNGHATLNLINREGHTLLHFAALLGFVQLSALLLRAGANVDIHDRNGYTALAFAAMAGRDGSVKGLLTAGAQLGACTFSNETPAMLALRGGHMDVVQFLHHASIADSPIGSSHARKASISNSDSSPDADNPSSATDSESLASADRQLGGIMSPQRLTTTDDIEAVRHPQRQFSSMSIAKSDTTATPKARQPFALPSVEPRPELKARSHSTASTERPPPYNPTDDTSWLQRTLSHLPGSQIMPMAPHLKDYISPNLWDKLPSAQLLIPNMPLLRPGEILENTWQSQAWLAVPLSAWLSAQPKVSEAVPVLGALDSAGPGLATNVTVPEARPDLKPVPRTFVRPRVSASARKAARAKEKEVKAEREKEKVAPPSETSSPLAEVSSQVAKLKPDRMLFFFWLPVLVGAFVYTLVTTLPYALARAVFGPAFRVLRSLI